MGNVCAACDAEYEEMDTTSRNLKKQSKPMMIHQEAGFVTNHHLEDSVAKRVLTMNDLSNRAQETQKKLDEFNFNFAKDAYIDITGKDEGLGIENFVGPYRYNSDSSTYEGHVVDGMREGLGVNITKKGDCYEGSWVNDKPEGYGRYIQFNGDYYEGEFLQGYPHKKGKMVYKISGIEYEGEFNKGKNMETE